MNSITSSPPAHRRWTPARRLTVAALMASLAAWTSAVSGAAADEPRLEDLELRYTGGYYTAEALTRDSDGDGWSDWYERLQGTDPKDPASHPEHARLEIDGTTGFVQSTTFPDRLVSIDLDLPEGKSVTMDALDLVSRFGGLSPTGKLHDQLTGLLKELQGGEGRIAELISEADTFRQTDQPAHLGSAFDLSLVADGSIGHAKKQVGDYVVTVGGEGGNPYIEVNDALNRQAHVVRGFGVDSEVAEIINLGDNVYLVRTSYYRNGDNTGSSLLKRNSETGEYWLTTYDKDGNIVSEEYNPPDKKPQSTPSQGASPTESAGQPSSSESKSGEGSSSSSSAATSSSDDKKTETPGTTPTATNTYSDPGADPLYVPTAAEAAARLAFLSGVRARYADKKPQLDPTTLIPEPGVSDPAEPGCDKAGCVYFVEVHEPRLGNVNGGDPVNPDFLP